MLLTGVDRSWAKIVFICPFCREPLFSYTLDPRLELLYINQDNTFSTWKK